MKRFDPGTREDIIAGISKNRQTNLGTEGFVSTSIFADAASRKQFKPQCDD